MTLKGKCHKEIAHSPTHDDVNAMMCPSDGLTSANDHLAVLCLLLDTLCLLLSSTVTLCVFKSRLKLTSSILLICSASTSKATALWRSINVLLLLLLFMEVYYCYYYCKKEEK